MLISLHDIYVGRSTNLLGYRLLQNKLDRLSPTPEPRDLYELCASVPTMPSAKRRKQIKTLVGSRGPGSFSASLGDH